MDPTRRDAIPAMVSGLFSADTMSEQFAELKALVEKQSKEITKLQEQLSWVSRAATPVGTVIAYAGEWLPMKNNTEKWTEAELGWLLCDGRKWDDPTLKAIPPQMLAELKRILGGYYQDGLPKSQGRVLIAAGTGVLLTTKKLGEAAGAETHTLTLEEMPRHDHGVTDNGHGHNLSLGRGGKRFSGGGGADFDDQNAHVGPHVAHSSKTGISILPKGGNDNGSWNKHNNMQPYLVMNFIIKFSSRAVELT